MLCAGMLPVVLLTGCMQTAHPKTTLTEYEKTSTGEGYIYRMTGRAQNICTGEPILSEDAVPSLLHVHSAALMDLTDKKVVYGHNMMEHFAPASTTKIMTALLTLENCSLDEEVTVSAKAASYSGVYTVAGLKEGDKVSVKNLLYGLMLPSGNDAATALAEYISGSVEDFAVMMTKRAKELGARNTQFLNANGIDMEGHYTCGYDLYLIFQEALKYPEFREIIKTARYSAPIRNIYGYVRKESYIQTDEYITGAVKMPEGITVLGGKTGTTDQAGKCLVLLAENKASKPYIAVILGAKDGPDLYKNMNALLSCANEN